WRPPRGSWSWCDYRGGLSAPQPQPAVVGRRRRVLGALRHRNYRLFFTGQVISQVGTWMQSIALPWLVLLLTHNDLLVGVTLACQFLPMLVLGPLGGIVADRFHKRRILLITRPRSWFLRARSSC